MTKLLEQGLINILVTDILLIFFAGVFLFFV